MEITKKKEVWLMQDGAVKLFQILHAKLLKNILKSFTTNDFSAHLISAKYHACCKVHGIYTQVAFCMKKSELKFS